MLIQIACLIIGFILLIKGADVFVEGASKLSTKMNVPPIVIGLTVVAFGTSAPEAAISITSGMSGNADLSVGNIIGSNIINVLVILGISGCITCLKVNCNTYKYEIPFVMLITLLLMILGKLGGTLNYLDGIILWILFFVFLYYLYRLAKSGENVTVNEIEKIRPQDTLFRLILVIVLGIIAIIFGSDLTIDAATYIATKMNISQRLIGLTIIAFGTSLPELVTSIMASLKGKCDLAVGNIVGSNIFNILFVLGTTALVCPEALAFKDSFIIDGMVAIGALFLLYVFIGKDFYLKKSWINYHVG